MKSISMGALWGNYFKFSIHTNHVYLTSTCFGQCWGSQNCLRMSGWISTSARKKRQVKNQISLQSNLHLVCFMLLWWRKLWNALWQSINPNSNHWMKKSGLEDKQIIRYCRGGSSRTALSKNNKKKGEKRKWER